MAAAGAATVTAAVAAAAEIINKPVVVRIIVVVVVVVVVVAVVVVVVLGSGCGGRHVGSMSCRDIVRRGQLTLEDLHAQADPETAHPRIVNHSSTLCSVDHSRSSWPLLIILPLKD